MAFANFSLSTAYATVVSMLNTQLTAVGKLFKNQTTGDFTDQVRYNSTGQKLEYWTGSAWAELNIKNQTINGASVLGAVASALVATSATNAATATSATTATDAANATNSSGSGTIPKVPETGMKIIRGSIAANGTISAGTGFTVNTGAAPRQIVFTTAFSGRFTIVMSTESASANAIAAAGYVNTSTAYYATGYANGAAGDFPVDFIAIGPN